MATDYTAWPTTTDVAGRLSNLGITLRASVTTDRKQQAIDAVTAEVGRRTFRQFVADAADATRYYDGSGTPELDVDEMVALTSAAVIGIASDPGYTLADVTLVSEQGRPKTRIIVARGSVPAFATSAVFFPFTRQFPAGRQNIAVTGKFGYGSEIPRDLWAAVCEEAAARLARESLFTPGTQLADGSYLVRMTQFTDEDVKQVFELVDSGEGTRWTKQFADALTRYRRPAGKRLRRARPVMI